LGEKMVADDLLFPQVLFHEGLIDDQHRSACGPVALAKEAASLQWNPKGPKIIGRDVAKVCDDILIISIPYVAEPVVQIALIRKREPHRGRLDPRQFTNPPKPGVEKLVHLLAGRIAGILQRETRHNDVPRIETGTQPIEMRESTDEQTG